MPSSAPENPEPWSAIFADLDPIVLSGNTHWHHPHFFAYYPTSCSYPSIVADILSGGIACIGFSWVSLQTYRLTLAVRKFLEIKPGMQRTGAGDD
jgi:aromatic-L-amino-acid decarboxylase